MQTLRIFHSADWHIGKGLGTIERTEDFKAFIAWFLTLVQDRRPDVLLIAGDVFDTSMPANSAQKIYYDFLLALQRTSVKAVVITAGNHDSQRFLEAPSAILQSMNCFIAGETIDDQALVLRHDDGTPWLAAAAVPYLREGDVRSGSLDDTDASRAARFEAGVKAHYDAVAAKIDEKLAGVRVPKIAMGHLFVTGSRLRPDTEPTTASESVNVGSLRNVTADAFGTGWDYVALGHIHSSQTLEARVPMRYSGSPLTLSYSHTKHQYHHHIVELTVSDEGLTFEELPVAQPREFLVVKGSFAELQAGIEAAGKAYHTQTTDGIQTFKPFVEATLTTDEIVPDLASRLTRFGEDCGVTVTAVRNERTAQRYAEDELNAPSLDDLNPESVFKSFLDERFDSDEAADDAFEKLLPLLREAVTQVGIEARPQDEDLTARALQSSTQPMSLTQEH